MFAKNLERVLASITGNGDLSGNSSSTIEAKFASMRSYGVLPGGRENRDIPLATSQIAAAILGITATQPGWSGEVAICLQSLMPVGGHAAAFAQSKTLRDAVERILTDRDDRDRIVSVTVTTAESFKDSHGLASVRFEHDHSIRTTHFVRREAVSLLDPGGEKHFKADYHHAPMTSSTTFNRKFFKELASSLATFERLSPPVDGDGSEYDDEEARKEQFRRLGVRRDSRYLNIGVDNHVTWPRKELLISFDQYQLVLMPKTKDHVQSVHVDLVRNRLTDIEAMTVVNRFLSVLTWCDDHFAVAQGGWSGNPVPVAVAKRNLAFITTEHWFLNRSIPASDNGRRALALYREARNAEENGLVSYAVLNYYKITEILYPDGRESRAWIGENFDVVVAEHRDNHAMQAFAKQCGEQRPEKFIYESYRLAVAHASSKTKSDPDDVTELRRLHTAADVLRLFARHLISNELKISETFESD